MPHDVRTDDELITQRRAEVLGLGYVDTTKLQKQLYHTLLGVSELKQLKVVPLLVEEHSIHFGITTTTSQQAINRLKDRFSDRVTHFSLISENGYQEYMRLYDPPKKVEYHDITLAETKSEGILESVSKTLSAIRADDMLAYLVQQAYKLKASDIHLENQKDDTRVRLRIDGVLHPVASLSHEKYRHLTAAVASAANISTSADDAQQGHVSRQYKLATGEEVTINLRVETVPAYYGMDIVMRLFNLNLEMFKLENLSLSQQEMEAVTDIINRPTGMVIVVGPTGSGKTTTLYSMISSLNTPERKIITLEDPVEYNLPGVVQIPVRGALDTEHFAERLRSVLRLDPDVVMVGEVRDKDTAKTALQGALTGHLVLTTFHAAGAAAALTRMLDMVGINPLFASAMRLVMAQRLVRRLDEHTKQPYRPDEDLKGQLRSVIDSLPPNMPRPDLDNLTLFKPGGSDTNPFGFSGQLPIREQLLMTPGVQQLLRRPPNEVTTELLQEQAVKDGMRTMLQDGVLKAIAGLTTIDEVYRVAS